MSKNIKQAEKMKADIENKFRKWNERSQFTLKGVKNLSKGDMDMLVMYADMYIRTGGTSFNGMHPTGNIAEILEKYNITLPSSNW